MRMLKLGKVVTLRLPEEVLSRIEKQADREQVKVATEIRRIIVTAVQQN